MCLTPKWASSTFRFLPQFIPAGHSPVSWTFLLVTIHVLIGTLWSLTLITATRYAAGILKKTSRGEMDGPDNRLPVSAICREAGHEPPVGHAGAYAPVSVVFITLLSLSYIFIKPPGQAQFLVSLLSRSISS